MDYDDFKEGCSVIKDYVDASGGKEYTYNNAIKIANFLTNSSPQQCGLFMVRLNNLTSNNANQYMQCYIPLGKYNGFAPNEPIIAFGTEDGVFSYPLQHITCVWTPGELVEDYVLIKNTDTQTHTVNAIIYFALQEATT